MTLILPARKALLGGGPKFEFMGFQFANVGTQNFTFSAVPSGDVYICGASGGSNPVISDFAGTPYSWELSQSGSGFPSSTFAKLAVVPDHPGGDLEVRVAASTRVSAGVLVVRNLALSAPAAKVTSTQSGGSKAIRNVTNLAGDGDILILTAYGGEAAGGWSGVDGSWTDTGASAGMGMGILLNPANPVSVTMTEGARIMMAAKYT